MKKTYLLLLFTLFSQIGLSQEVLKDELNKLFLDLNLGLKFNEIASKSNQKFEYSEDVDYNSNLKTKIYSTTFKTHPFITSEMLSGSCNIKQVQKEKNLKKEKYDVDLIISFKTLDEVISEYKKLSDEYKKFGHFIEESTIDGENGDIGYQNYVINIETETKTIALTFMYTIPGTEKSEYELYIACSYQNLWYK